MTHLKQISAGCILFSFSIHVWATPIAVSRIQADLSKATLSFTFDNETGAATQTQSPQSYSDLHVENNGNDIQTPHLDGDGSISATSAGAVASAHSSNGASLNIVSATGDQGLAYANSVTSTYLAYQVDNLSALVLSIPVTASLDLSTQTLEDDAYASWEDDIDLFKRDPLSGNLVEFAFSFSTLAFSDMEVFAGDHFSSGSNTVALPYSFNFDSPFSGELVIQNIATAHGEAFVAPSASVPEPAPLGLWVMGMAAVGFARLFRKVKAS
jgi:hypothetical protein